MIRVLVPSTAVHGSQQLFAIHRFSLHASTFKAGTTHGTCGPESHPFGRAVRMRPVPSGGPGKGQRRSAATDMIPPLAPPRSRELLHAREYSAWLTAEYLISRRRRAQPATAAPGQHSESCAEPPRVATSPEPPQYTEA